MTTMGGPGGDGGQSMNPRPSGRSALGIITLIAGLALAAVAIAWGATSIASLLWMRSEENVLRTELTSEGSAVVVDNGCGPITLVEGSPGVVRTQAEVRWTFRKPTVTSETSGDVVRVRVDCPSFTVGVSRSSSVTVAVPPAATVEARSSAGGVKVTGLTGPLTLRTSAGSIRGENLRSTTVDAETSAGEVLLSFAEPPQDVRASTSAGSATVLVPDDGTSYAVDASTSAGSESVAVRTDPTSDRSIEVTSSAGSVRVGYSS